MTLETMTMLDQRIHDLDKALKRSRGGVATLWEYSSSLSELTLRISWAGRSDNIHLVCNGCVRVEAPTTWSGVDLRYQRREANADELRLIDGGAQFLVICRQIRVFTDVEPRFDTP
jgi:hypothetical protein